MVKFGYGIAFNLTLMEMGRAEELKFLGVSKKQKDSLLHKKYLLKEDPSLSDDAEAEYSWEEIDNNLKEVFNYKADLNTKSLEDNIIAAGHEMVHAMRYNKHATLKSWMNFVVRKTNKEIDVKKSLKKNAGLLTGLGLLSLKNVTSDNSNITNIVVFAAGVIGTKLALGNAIDYNEELKAYTYQEKLGVMLMKPPSLSIVAANLENLKEKQKLLNTAKECFVVGYPSIEKCEIIKLQTQHGFLKNTPSLFSPQRILELHNLTDQHVRQGRYNISEI